MSKILLILLFVTLSSADICTKPKGSGTKSGADWDNACTTDAGVYLFNSETLTVRKKVRVIWNE